MRKTRRAGLFVLVAFLSSLLIGCGQTTIEIGMRETSVPGHWQASYETFSGTKSNTAQATNGQTMTLTYDTTLNKGTLEIQVENPLHETIWDVSLHESTKATVDFVLYDPGTYYVIVKGNEASGSFDITWKIQ